VGRYDLLDQSWKGIDDSSGFEARGVAVAPGGDVVVANVESGAEGLYRIVAGGIPEALWTASPGADLHQVARSASGEFLVAEASENRLVRVDPGAGAAVALAEGGLLDGPVGVAIVPEPRRPRAGEILVATESPGAGLFLLDPATGARRAVAIGGELSAPRHVAMTSQRDVCVADAGVNGVVHVDLETGAQTRIFQDFSDLADANGIGADRDGRLWVSDRLAHRVLQVDPGGWSGTRLTLPGGVETHGIATGSDGTVLIGAVGSTNIWELPTSGALQAFDATPGFDATGIAITASGRLIAANARPGFEGIVEVPGGGAPHATLWRGNPGMLPGQLAIEPGDTHAVMIDRSGGRLLRVDLAQGTAETVAEGGILHGAIGLAIVPAAACANGRDDDADGLSDHPDDFGCTGPHDVSEAFACSDGIDNDGDGLADAADFECTGAEDVTELPEPTQDAMLSSGFVLLALLGRRRARIARAFSVQTGPGGLS
jgi:streptogramin lyase